MNDQTEIPEVKAANSLHRGAKEQKVESAGRAERTPLPCPSDWTFDLIEEYNTEIARVAEAYKLDIYPIQLEIITAEQMMDAYASVGMPVNYRHWSFGKHFLCHRKRLSARADGAGLRNRHQFESLHRVSDGREHDDDAGAGDGACGVRAQLFFQGQLPVPAVDRRARDHRLPGVREELHRRMRRTLRTRSLSRNCSIPATR